MMWIYFVFPTMIGQCVLMVITNLPICYYQSTNLPLGNSCAWAHDVITAAHHVPKWMSCHEAIDGFMITGRFLQNSSTLCIMNYF